MLVLHPKSSCDVCLECYVPGGGVHSPQLLATCGHTFCRGCVNQFKTGECPVCRTEFQEEDVRPLHIDGVDQNAGDENAEQDIVSEASMYQATISRIVRQGAPSSTLKTFLEECRRWLKNQPADSHDTLRVSFLLLYNFTEATRKLGSESQTLSEIKRKLGDLQLQMATDKETNNRKYHELQESSKVSIQTAVAAEKAIKDQHDEAVRNWAKQYDEVLDRCKSLEQELAGLQAAHGIDSSADDIANLKATRLESVTSASSALSSGNGFHLSPLPVELPLLSSSKEGFRPLAEDEDDLDGEMFEDDAGNTKPLAEPIHIPYRSRPMLNASAMAMPSDEDQFWKSNSPSSMRSIHPLKPATSFSSMTSAADGQFSSVRGINPARQQGYGVNGSTFGSAGMTALKDILDGSKGSPTESFLNRGRAGSTASMASNVRRSSTTYHSSSHAQPINIGQPRRTGSPHSFNSSSPDSRRRGDSSAGPHPQRPSPMSSASDAARAMERPSSAYGKDGRGPSVDRVRVRVPA